MTSLIPLSLLSILSLSSTNLSASSYLSAFLIMPANCLLTGVGSISLQEGECSLYSDLDISGTTMKISMKSTPLSTPLLAICLTSFFV